MYLLNTPFKNNLAPGNQAQPEPFKGGDEKEKSLNHD
jgi:hypothetical protein